MDKEFSKKITDMISGNQDKESSIAEIPDKGLVKLFVNNGDETAFEELVNRHVDKIYSLALRITRNPGDSEEVLQQVFLKLFEKLYTFRGESKFSSWLYTVTVNASYMYIRAGKKHNFLSLDDYTNYDETGTFMEKIESVNWSDKPDTANYSKEAMEIIDKAIDELSEPYRIVFHLRDIEGLSNREVAEVLDISVPAVKSRLHRARLQLRDGLIDYFHEWRS